MKHYKLLLVAALMGVAACNSEEESIPMPDAALEIKGIRAAIGADEVRVLTRADEAATKQLQIGRTGFVDKDTIVFTTIQRTKSPLDAFTYSNIHYQYDGTKWERIANGTTNDPEKIYWTDASSDHTFIGYSLPQGYQWSTVTNGTGSDTYAGELGYGKDAIVYTSSEDLEKEDLLILHSDTTKADPGGLTTTVYFTHALSNVQVVVNIKNFAASASAVDTLVKVSHMVLHSQPCKYTWGATSKVDVTARDFGVADQTTKDITLWCPKPDGEGKAQSKTFTFYGITTPQNATFHGIPGNKQPLKFSFEVEYPDAMNPGQTVKKNYSGAFSSLVDFKPGMQTTLNISLNHKDEQMFTGVTYTDWNFVETPDLGKLRKKSTFMDMTAQEEGNVKVHTDAVTVDDATWLYQDGNDVKDIYGHDGTSAQKAYVIKSAQQLLALAKEVNSDYTFKGKFIRLEADITMQKSAKDSTYIWNGIGDADHPFEGTFLGGDRYINRLHGQPLFAHLGQQAHVEQLQITSIRGITGGGALAGTNKGVIAACRVIDDVESTGGALVGTNSGTIYACYYTGTNGYKLIGEGSEGIGCYEAKTIQSMSFSEIQAQVDGWNKALEAWYEGKSYTKYVYEYQPGSYPTVKPK